MNVIFERTGGFTGIPLAVTIDSTTLSTEQSAQLHRLVDAADFFHLPSTLISRNQPDRFHYQVTIQDGQQQHTVTVTETAIPPSLKPLLDWLLEAAHQHP